MRCAAFFIYFLVSFAFALLGVDFGISNCLFVLLYVMNAFSWEKFRFVLDDVVFGVRWKIELSSAWVALAGGDDRPNATV